MHTAPDPYRAPAAPVADVPVGAAARLNLLVPKGRLDQVRYVAYDLGFQFIIVFVAFVLSIATTLTSFPKPALSIIWGVATVALILFHASLSIQRAHDFNAPGWLTIFAFVPMVHLLFWIMPSSEGENRFGPKAPPNRLVTIVLAFLLPVVLLIVVADILAPAKHPHY